VVDVEDDAARVRCSLHLGASRAVEIAVDLGPLHELVQFDQLLERLAADEVVLAAVLLAGAGLSGGVGNAEA